MAANDRQEGGNHYKMGDKPQHWDLVLMYDWDYFQGQIIKYLMRWKFKYDTHEKRMEDLRKARHFLDKYIEAHEYAERVGFLPKLDAEAPNSQVPFAFTAAMTHELTWEQKNPEESKKWQNEGYYGDGTCLWRCLECRKIWRGQTPPTHSHKE